MVAQMVGSEEMAEVMAGVARVAAMAEEKEDWVARAVVVMEVVALVGVMVGVGMGVGAVMGVGMGVVMGVVMGVAEMVEAWAVAGVAGTEEMAAEMAGVVTVAMMAEKKEDWVAVTAEAVTEVAKVAGGVEGTEEEGKVVAMMATKVEVKVVGKAVEDMVAATVDSVDVEGEAKELASMAAATEVAEGAVAEAEAEARVMAVETAARTDCTTSRKWPRSNHPTLACLERRGAQAKAVAWADLVAGTMVAVKAGEPGEGREGAAMERDTGFCSTSSRQAGLSPSEYAARCPSQRSTNSRRTAPSTRR